MAQVTSLTARHAGRRVPHASAEAKLALVEFLLGSEDILECARRGAEWLAEHTAVERVVVAAVNPDLTRLVGLVGYGVAPARIKKFSVRLDARSHPFLPLLDDGEPKVFAGNGADPSLMTPLANEPFLAVPLRGRVGKQPIPAGLLLVSPVAPDVTREARWLAEVLGHRMVRPRYYGRMARDRSWLATIMNAVPDAVLLTDPEGRMILANSRAEALLASRDDDSEGRRRAVALNNMLFSSALGERTFRPDDTPERRELLLVDPAEGSDLPFELLTTVVDDSREGTGIVSVLRNVADLRRATEEIEANYRRLRVAEADIRAERDRLDLIIDSVADPIVVTDPTGNIVMMNMPAERLFTMPPDATAEEAGRVRANDANFTSFVSNLFFGMAEMRYRGGISLVDPRTGALVPVEGVSGKIISEHGEVSAIVTILHDQTEALERERLYEALKLASQELEEKVRQATAELVRQNELLRRQAIELEQASAAKSLFLANMSHEFRTPLNAILGYTSILLKGVAGPLQPMQRDNLARVDSNGRHLLAIINDILDISRIEAGRMPLHLSEFKLPELIREVMVEVDPLIARSRLKMASELADDLPVMRSDRGKLKQIVLNLLTNALKFTAEGSVHVAAVHRPATGQVAIRVTDTGIGIAEADQAKIFEDFQQADTSSTRVYGGAGLGLSICRRLATMLEGQITLESQLGQGSTFTLTLPVRVKRR